MGTAPSTEFRNTYAVFSVYETFGFSQHDRNAKDKIEDRKLRQTKTIGTNFVCVFFKKILHHSNHFSEFAAVSIVKACISQRSTLVD